MCQISQHEGGEGEQVESFEGCVEPFVVSGEAGRPQADKVLLVVG